MLPKSIAAVKFWLVFVTICFSPCGANAAGLPSPATINLIGKIADTGALTTAKDSFLKRTFQGISTLVTASQGFDSGAAGNTFSDTAIKVGATTLGASIGGRVLGVALLPLGPGFALGGYVVGLYVGEAAGDLIGKKVADWLQNHPTTTAKSEGAPSSPTQPASPAPGNLPANSNFEFEGRWTESGPTCNEFSYVYTRSSIQSTFDKDDRCRISNVRRNLGDEYVLDLICNDASGDGPTPQFKTRQTIRMTGLNRMEVFRPDVPQPSVYTRCPNNPAPSPTLRSAATAGQANGKQTGLVCDLTVGNERVTWSISIALGNDLSNGFSGLYTARIGNQIVRQRQTAMVRAASGRGIGFEMFALHLRINNGRNPWLVILGNSRAFITNWSSTESVPAGSCRNGAFAGL